MSWICGEINQAAVPNVQPDFTILSDNHQAEESGRLALVSLHS
jgi:hypothetical protein